MKLEVTVAVPQQGEIFTHKDDDGTIRSFPVCMMREFLKSPDKGPLVHLSKFTMNKKLIGLIRNQMGIEQERLDRLKSPYLDEPGIGIFWTDGVKKNTMTLIDGNHRAVKKFESGQHEMDVWLFHPLIWQQFLVLKFDKDIEEAKLNMPSRMIEFENGRL